MEFVPAPNEGEQNYSKNSGAKNFLALCLGAGLIVAAAMFVFTNFIYVAIKLIPEGKEYEPFERSQPPGIDEKLVPAQKRLEELTFRLNRCAQVKNKIYVTIKQGEEPNAAAALDGTLSVNSALFSRIKSQNGLAFVLAHELSHFKHRDHAKSIGSALVVSLIFGFSDDKISSYAATAASSKFSRSQEAAADAEALKILECAYGHVGGAEEFFESMLPKNGSPAFMNIFGSYPDLDSRIKAIKTSKFPKRQTEPLDKIFTEIKE